MMLQCPLCGIQVNDDRREKLEHTNYHFTTWMALVAEYDFDTAGEPIVSIHWQKVMA